jgi:hypothetical protein
MTPTGTNLLGLVKHCMAVESVYFGRVIDRPLPGKGGLDWHGGGDTELSGAFLSVRRDDFLGPDGLRLMAWRVRVTCVVHVRWCRLPMPAPPGTETPFRPSRADFIAVFISLLFSQLAVPMRPRCRDSGSRR